MRKLFVAIASSALIASAVTAFGDYTIKDSGGVVKTIFAFTCATTKICPASVPIKSDGTEIFTSSNPAQVTGANGSFPATVTDGGDVTQGAKADSACGTDTGTCTVTALIKRANQNLTTVNNSLGSPLVGVSQAQTSSADSSLVAKSSAGSVVSISGSAVSGSYIMLFDATSAPEDGSVTPVKCWGPMAADGPFSFGWGPGPVLTMSTGITVVSSSTGCFTKTATNANFIAVEYQ